MLPLRFNDLLNFVLFIAFSVVVPFILPVVNGHVLVLGLGHDLAHVLS